MAEKYAWVREWLGEDFLSRIVVTRDKTVVGGRVLIDDKPKISGCLSEEERDWVHVIFEQSYNVGVGGVRMRGWAEYKHVLGEFFDALRM